MNKTRCGLFCLPRGSQLLLGLMTTFALCAVAHGQSSPKPAFQYEVGDVRVSIPTADEPRVKAFGKESLQAAAKYLETGAASWLKRDKACVNCHTTGPYMTDFTAWSRRFGQPYEDVLKHFVKAVPMDI